MPVTLMLTQVLQALGHIRPSSLTMCFCPPCQMQNQKQHGSTRASPAPPHQVEYSFLLYPSFPQIKQSMHVDLKILYAFLCTISIFLTSKCSQAFWSKNYMHFLSEVSLLRCLMSLHLYKLNSVTYLISRF